MDLIDDDGLIYLQSQSHISASKWREWCALFELEPGEVVDVWNEICYPIMLSTREVPPVAYILQLRVDRRETNVFDFKEEIAKPLSFLPFLHNLQDECLSGDKNAIFTFYRRVMSPVPATEYATPFVKQFVVGLCTVVLVAKVLKKSNITLSNVLGVLIKGQATLPKLVDLGLKSLGEEPYAGAVRRCLTDQSPDAAEVPDQDKQDRESGPGEEMEDDAGQEDAGGETEGTEVEAGEEAVESAAEGTEVEAGEEAVEEEDFIAKFRAALRAIYKSKLVRDDTADQAERVKLLEKRLEAITAFDPLRTVIPSLEEAQAMVEYAQATQKTKGGVTSPR